VEEVVDCWHPVVCPVTSNTSLCPDRQPLSTVPCLPVVTYSW